MPPKPIREEDPQDLAMQPPAVIHFIGICGVGMSAVAKLLKDAGHQISGSDAASYPPASTLLASAGIPVFSDYHPANIPPHASLLIIGRNAKLDPSTNPEVKAAVASGIPIKSFPEVLASLLSHRRRTAVVGSYGKSTTTALIAHVLHFANRRPSYFVGACPLTLPHSAALGSGDHAIIEGDEYPSSVFDNKSKFLHFFPHDVVLISATHDHVNIFPTLSEYLSPYTILLNHLPPNGSLIACIDNANVTTLLPQTSAAVVTYSLHNTSAHYYASNITLGALSTFSLYRNGRYIMTIKTPLLGLHNIQNIIGASAFLFHRFDLDPATIAQGLATFRGVARRLECKTNSTRVRVFDGFGSSYAKARAAINAVRAHFPNRRLVIIFEPYEFSWRSHDTIDWYDTAFIDADIVFVHEPPVHGAATHRQLSHSQIISRIQNSGVRARPLAQLEQALDAILSYVRADDAILMISSGPIGGLVDILPQKIDELYI